MIQQPCFEAALKLVFKSQWVCSVQVRPTKRDYITTCSRKGQDLAAQVYNTIAPLNFLALATVSLGWSSALNRLQEVSPR